MNSSATAKSHARAIWRISERGFLRETVQRSRGRLTKTWLKQITIDLNTAAADALQLVTDRRSSYMENSCNGHKFNAANDDDDDDDDDEPLALPVTVDRRETGELENKSVSALSLYSYTYGSFLTAQALQPLCRYSVVTSRVAVSVP